jgi:hypothetical protein
LFAFTVKGKESEWKRKSPQRGKKSQAEEETDSKLAEPWKQSDFSLQLAVMPLLAGS